MGGHTEHEPVSTLRLLNCPGAQTPLVPPVWHIDGVQLIWGAAQPRDQRVGIPVPNPSLLILC